MTRPPLKKIGLGVLTVAAAMLVSPDRALEPRKAGFIPHLFDALQPPLALAQGEDEGGNISSRFALNPVTTSKITRPMRAALKECPTLKKTTNVSCLAAAFRRAAREADNQQQYSKAREILNDAAKKLDALARRNEDKAVPKTTGKNGRYRAVKPKAVPAVNRAALKIVQETETKLLRSTGNSKARRQHYQDIAMAVGSTKKILRS
ncbi:MAG: hypothetical protein AAF393_04945 [Pseudomonadota bacterium]